MVQDVLKDQVAEPHQSRAPSMDVIQTLVANYYNIAMDDLVGKSRSRPLVHARQVAMYLCREMTDATLIEKLRILLISMKSFGCMREN